MSSSEDTAITAAEYNSLVLSDYCSNSATALYMYEYLITIDYEVELFWKRKFTGASALFFLNRYLRLWFYITELMLWAPLSTPVCATLTRFTFVFDLFAYIVWAAFSGLRMFAVSGKNWFLSILVFALSVVPFAIDLVNMRYGITGETLPVYGCSGFELTPVYIERKSFALPVTIADRTCLMAADCFLIVVTWFALPKRAFRSSPNTFAFVLLCDGTIYFVILLILNALHLGFTLASLVIPALQNESDLIIFVEPITAILVQRFLIHLQLANRKTLHLDTSQPGGSSQDVRSLVFERVIGSLNASLTLDDYISYTDVDSEVLKESMEGSDVGMGDVDVGGGRDSIPLEPVCAEV